MKNDDKEKKTSFSLIIYEYISMHFHVMTLC